MMVASAVLITEKYPLIPQAQGTAPLPFFAIYAIPVGNGIPIMNPRGTTKRIRMINLAPIGQLMVIRSVGVSKLEKMISNSMIIAGAIQILYPL